MGALSAAIGKDTLDRTKDLAQDAASRLAALPVLRLIRKTKAVPKSHIKATAGTDLVCSPKLDAIGKSLAGTFRSLWPRPCKATPYGPSSTRW